MSDLSNLKLNFDNYISIIKSSKATQEQKEQAIAEAEKLQYQIKQEYLKDLDTNGDGFISKEEYKKSAEYIDYLHSTTDFITSKRKITPNNTKDNANSTTQNFDIDDNGRISTLEYEAQLYSNTNNQTQNEEDSLILRYLSYISELQNEKVLTNPQNLIKEINIRVQNFKNELNNGNYTAEEIEKYLSLLNGKLSNIKSQISISYDRQFMANYIDSERDENRRNKSEFSSLMDSILNENQSLLRELQYTHSDEHMENSYIIATNINNIKTAADIDNLLDSNFTMQRIIRFIQQIENSEMQNAFLGSDRNKYMSKETAELIVMALTSSKESVIAKLKEQLNSETDESKKAEIQSRLDEYTSKFDALINEYQELSENANSRKRDYSIPEEIKPLLGTFNGAKSIPDKRKMLKDIQAVLDNMINNISSKYLMLSGNDNISLRQELRSQLLNLYDLKEVFNIPDEISDRVLGTSNTAGSSSIMTTLSQLYTSFVTANNGNGLNSEAAINLVKSEIRKLVEQAGLYQQTQYESELKAYGNSNSNGTRYLIRNNINELIENYPDIRKIKVYDQMLLALEKLKADRNSNISDDEYKSEKDAIEKARQAIVDRMESA